MKHTEFNGQYINELESANYFGGYNGETQKEIDDFRDEWVWQMELLGYPIGSEILDEDGYESSKFEAACNEALEIALEIVSGW